MKRFIQCAFFVLAFLNSITANSLPVSGRLLPINSVSVPNSNADGTYSVWIDSAPETNPDGWIELQEQKDGGSYVTIEPWIVGGGSVQVSDRYTANYRYRAKRCLGLESTKCTAWVYSNVISVVRTPDIPSAPSSNTKSTNGSINVTWSKPSGVVSHYDLQKRLGNGSWISAGTKIASTSKIVTGLSNGNWIFRVRACDSYSGTCSAYSAASAINYVRFKPSRPAVSSSGVQSTNGDMPVSWSEPSSTVTFYDLQKRNNDGSWSNAVTGISSTSVTLSGLSDGNWTFRVRACNEFSWACSDYSETSGINYVRIRPATPEAPEASTQNTSSSVSVSWNKPSGVVTYYDLQKRLDGGSWSDAIVGTSATSGTPNNLEQGDWTFRVRACNEFNWSCSSYSPASDIGYVRFKPSVPQVPNVPIQTLNQGITIDFGTVPSSSQYYKLFSRRGSSENFNEHNSGNRITSDSITVTGLADGDWYFKVALCNSFDWACSTSGISDAVNVRQLPQNVSLFIPSESKQRRSYTAEFSASSTVTQWTLQERVVGNSAWETVYQGSGTSKSFAKTQPDQTWQYRLTACNTSIACVSTPLKNINIIPLIVDDIYDATLESPSIPNHDPTVGHLNPEVSINGGAVQLSLPIVIPPGRAGIQPKITIKYSSAGGNGILGLGGSLVAAGEIQRCADIYQLDNRSRSVADDANDKLCLNGHRLMLEPGSGTYGGSGAIYYPETKPHLKVVQSGSLANSSFTVLHSDGSIDYYGDTSDSQVVRNGVRIAWKLRKSEDLQKNNIIYRYLPYEGGAYLSDIYYTGSGDAQGDRQIEFSYDSRNDVQIKYYNGDRELLSKRLKKISTYINGKLVREYDINYDPNTLISKLEGITLCAWSNSGTERFCYPKTAFSWHDWQPNISEKPIRLVDFDSANYISSHDEGVSANWDYDGDGTPDLVYNKYVKLSTIGSQVDLPFSSRLNGGNFDQSKSFDNSGLDVNLDGKIDHAGLLGGTINIASWDGEKFVVTDTGISYSCINWPYEDGSYVADPTRFRACSAYSLDFTGDGIQDVVTTEQSSQAGYPVYLKFYQGQRDGNFTYLGKGGPINIDTPLIVTDFDGDGRHDLIGLNRNALASSEIVVVNVDIVADKFQSVTINETGINVPDSWAPVYIDANRDGLIDVLKYNGDGWRLYVNSGGDLTSENYFVNWDRKLFQNIYMPPEGSPVNRYLHAYIRTIDYNRDGISDLVFPDDIVYENNCGLPCVADNEGLKDQLDIYSWKLVLGKLDSNGNITYEEEVSLPVEAPLTDLNIFDINGDGYEDFVTRLGRKITDSLAMTGPYSDSPGIYVYYNQNNNSDKIRKVTTGLGITHEFDYALLHSGDNFYQVTRTTRNFPYVNGSTNTYAIKEYRTSDGLGDMKKTTFSYKDVLVDLQGRGNLGFAEITERKYASVSDNQYYAEVVTTFAQDFPKTGSILTQTAKVRNDNGLLITTDSISNELSVVNGQLADTKFVYADTSIAKKYETDGSLISTEIVNRTYNYLGLLTEKKQNISDADGDVNKKTTETNNFTLDTENWWFKLNYNSERHQVSYGDTLQLPAEALTDVTVVKTYAYTDSSTRQPTRIITSSSDTSYNLVTTKRYGGPYKQLDKITLTSNGSGNTSIEGSRWTEMDYSSDGYFLTKTYNSAWGLTVAEKYVTYDARTGLPLTETDANNNITTYQYDYFGQLIEVNVSGTPKQIFSYQWCSAGCPIAATSRKAVYFKLAAQAGAPMVLTYYDALGREVYRETEGTDGTIVHWQSYDSLGRIVQVADPHYNTAAAGEYGIVEITAFDGLSRPITKTVNRYPISYSVNYSYSGFTTNITVMPSGLGDVLAMASRNSVLGKPMYHMDAKGQLTHFRYDALGNVAMIQDVAGNAITASYNGFGHKLTLNDPNMGKWQFLYNALGELRWQKDAKGQITTFNYDNLGRLLHEYPGSDPAHHYQFDIEQFGTLGRVYTGASTSPSFERIYTYDRLLREVSRITQIDGRVFEQKTAWDTNYGRVKGIKYPDGTIIEVLYDQTGRIIEEWDFVQGLKLRSVESRTATDAIGRQSYANALVEESWYNPAGQLERRCVSTVIANCSISDLIYDQYDSYGNLRQRRNAIVGVNEYFVYDELHRLTQSRRSWDAHLPATLHTTVDYGYDGAGNLLYKTDISDSGEAYQYGDISRATNNAGPNAVTSVRLKDDTIRSYKYDLNGNLTADGLRTISYGTNNKPRTISHSNGNTATFYYAPDGNRYKQVFTGAGATTTRYYLGAYELEETVQGGNTTVIGRTLVGNFAQYFSESLNGNLQSAGWQFLHRDHLGSIESVSDLAGTIKERRGFDPFGKVRDLNEDDTGGGLLNRRTIQRGFTGHEHLDGVELVHMNGRVYDYNLGRFLSVDPFISMLENSQAYNPYSYVMNSPLRYTDPTGYVVHLSELEGWATAVTEEVVQETQQTIGACNESQCSSVTATLSDGATELYLKSNGNGAGKIGAVVVNSRDSKGKASGQSVGGLPDPEASNREIAPKDFSDKEKAVIQGRINDLTAGIRGKPNGSAKAAAEVLHKNDPLISLANEYGIEIWAVIDKKTFAIKEVSTGFSSAEAKGVYDNTFRAGDSVWHTHPSGKKVSNGDLYSIAGGSGRPGGRWIFASGRDLSGIDLYTTGYTRGSQVRADYGRGAVTRHVYTDGEWSTELYKF